ncbi:MAG: hypothetical protein KAS07_05585 [Candidatus Pacebacteria bacterium]|nr:hypothetical protein [Candidatus Paceibacterota bacterium]
MFKKYTNATSLNVYLNAADALGLHHEILDARTHYALITDGKKTVLLKKTSPSWNGLAQFHFSRDKYATSQLLSKKGLPVPEGRLFTRDESEDVLEYAKKLVPVVIKRNSGAAGNNVFVKLEKVDEINHAVSEIVTHTKGNILVESYHEGTDYRALVFDGHVCDVIERIPAYVVGDGERDIETLIKLKNEERISSGIKSSLLKLDSMTRATLKKSGYELGSIVENGEKVAIRGGCNFSSGGEVNKIALEDIHPDNLELFIAAQQTIGLMQAGVDFISSDISVSYKENGAVINEVNGTIGVDIHYRADNKSTAAIESVLKYYFELS